MRAGLMLLDDTPPPHKMISKLFRASANSLARRVPTFGSARFFSSRMPAPTVPTFANEMAGITASFETFLPIENLDRPVIIKDLGVVERQYYRWVDNLPEVKPFYAVKCNPDPMILQELTALGAGFDCASKTEIESVLKLGVEPEDIIFANPIKTVHDLQYAKEKGIAKMTADNAAELQKIKENFPEAEVVLRLLPDDSGSVMRFGAKFGADIAVVPDLLSRARELNLKVIGTSFHIGSGCFDPSKYDSAIKLSRQVFDMADSMGMPRMTFLDVGGGFPGNPKPHEPGRDGVPSFETFANVIAKSKEVHFPSSEYPELEVIGEPGRYFATGAATLFTCIQGKRESYDAKRNVKHNLYYINDGVYSSFNCIMFDHAKPTPLPYEEFLQRSQRETERSHQRYSSHSGLPISNGVLSGPFDYSGHQVWAEASAGFSTLSAAKETEPHLATMFGPTCDSMDKIIESYPIRELEVGEWLVFDDMGAYTSAAASTFNGIRPPVHRYVRSIRPSLK